MQVDHDVPAPASHNVARKYDWDAIQVGDSFLTDNPAAARSSFAAYLVRGKYSLQKQPDGRWRFWRLG